MRDEVRELQELGMETVVNLIYSVSPRHTGRLLRPKKPATRLRIGTLSNMFQDVGGLLTPGARANPCCRRFCRTPVPSSWNITLIATMVWRRYLLY